MTRARDVADTQDNLGGAVAPFVAGKNGVIGGSFDFWQRGTSFVPASYNYGPDRFTMARTVAGSTVSRQSSGLDGFSYAARVQRDSGNTSTVEIQLLTTLETANSLSFAGKTVTLSFYARAGANYSSASSILRSRIVTGTGTDQVIQSFTGFTVVADNNATLTTSWTRYSFSVNIASSVTELGLFFSNTPVGTAGANDYYDITGVQLELGSVATPFARAGGSIGGELALCQRYFTKSYELTTAPASVTTVGSIVFPNGVTTVHTGYYFSVAFKQTMRAAPTVVVYSYNGNQNTVTEIGTGVDKSASSAVPNSNYLSQTGFGLNNVSGVSISFTNGGIIQYTASAEL